ncbi:MAG: helix-turn-helix domain-containing protein [Pseudomonadota bacterium]
MHQPEFRVYTTLVLAGPVRMLLKVSWDQVLSRSNMKFDNPCHPQQFVNAEDYIRLWDSMVALSPVDNIPRLLGQRLAAGPAVPVLMAMSTAPNYETGIARISEFKHLFGPVRFITRKKQKKCSIRIESDSTDVTLPASFSAPQIIYLHTKAQSLVTREIRPLEVSLPLSKQAREDLVDVFGIVQTKGNPEIVYAQRDMSVPFISENGGLWHAIAEDLRNLSKIAARHVPTCERVRSAFHEAFSITEPNMDYVCERLEISRNTLSRQLRAEGTSFQKLLDTTRKDMAIRYLGKSDFTNQQIAFLLGYRDANAFLRAFKKWTGKTPKSVRAKLRR